jgi:S1-C subfamily serine protease
LLKSILEQVGVELQRVVVSELKESTFYAHIDLVSGGKMLQIDSRPSDAIALALRFHKPIFVAKELFETALPSAPSGGRVEPASAKISGVTVQNLTAELASYFNLPEPKGVLVADVVTKEGGESLQRGDVIIALAGEAVNDVGDFRDKLSNGKGQTVILGVLRGGEEIQVRLVLTED